MIYDKEHAVIRNILGVAVKTHHQADDYLLAAAISKVDINLGNVREELGELMVGTAMLQG